MHRKWLEFQKKYQRWNQPIMERVNIHEYRCWGVNPETQNSKPCITMCIAKLDDSNMGQHFGPWFSWIHEWTCHWIKPICHVLSNSFKFDVFVTWSLWSPKIETLQIPKCFEWLAWSERIGSIGDLYLLKCIGICEGESWGNPAGYPTQLWKTTELVNWKISVFIYVYYLFLWAMASIANC